ncbi:MAG: hypothetical protein AVDCRST_MAG66-3766 [uncultured Pseudonocardia sp.]|uniref:Uncharacterized protein n=1 Tax=uncultured Pseudonocardia sp. TaxID=211455 RepID=A0A6J4QEE3_9PSEU|nr:MAG: hypothetical protein AVDCRST_MAG66-3766 [uncultured Pseudonocardia sp.]
MTDPLPLEDVLGIVERRRRRRARVRSVAAPVLSVAAVGVAGLVVAALQSGLDEGRTAPVTPAAPGISALPDAPTEPGIRTEPDARTEPDTGTEPAPVLDPYLRPDFLPALADLRYYDAGDPDAVDRAATDAEQLSRLWELELYPAAKAVLAQAAVAKMPIDLTDPQGDEAMAARFAAAGFTEADADRLARAWETDRRTARIVGGVLVTAELLRG